MLCSHLSLTAPSLPSGAAAPQIQGSRASDLPLCALHRNLRAIDHREKRVKERREKDVPSWCFCFLTMLTLCGVTEYKICLSFGSWCAGKMLLSQPFMPLYPVWIRGDKCVDRSLSSCLYLSCQVLLCYFMMIVTESLHKEIYVSIFPLVSYFNL